MASKVGSKAAPAGGNAAGLDAAKANALAAPTAAAKKAAGNAAAATKPPVSASNSMDAGMTPRGPLTPPMERINSAMGGDDGEGRKIRGYSQAQGGRRMGGGDGGPLSARRPTPNVPSPGTARRSQERREAAAAGGKNGGGEHPLMSIIKEMQGKLNTLAVAK